MSRHRRGRNETAISVVLEFLASSAEARLVLPSENFSGGFGGVEYSIQIGRNDRPVV